MIGIGRMPRAEQQRDGEREAQAAATKARNPLIEPRSHCSRPAGKRATRVVRAGRSSGA